MDIDYNAVFGVEAGANETETADTSTEETTTTASENETAEGVETEAETDTEGAKESEPAEQTEPQTKEDNARYAAIRRKAEQEAEARAKSQIDEVFKGLGLTNPYTGKPITTKEEYDEYSAALAEEKRSNVRESSGMSEAEFNQFVENLPEVREAKNAKQAYDQMRQKAALDAQIAELTKIDPEIKTVDDLMKHEKYPEIYEAVKNGSSIVGAYKSVCFDDLINRAAERGRQTALNNQAGKQHMESSVQHGQGAMTVPREVFEQYKLFMPKATEAEITAHYNKHHKKG